MKDGKPLVLVVDDEPAIHRFLGPVLDAEGYQVDHVYTGKEALVRIASSQPDIVLLDLGLPDIDGKEVIRQVRGWTATPIVVLSARDREVEKVEALDLGADDFINKPFGMSELMARLRAALRHHQREAPTMATITARDLMIDLAKRRVTKAGEDVHLTRKEFDLLAFLARHAGMIVTHHQILTQIWGRGHEDDTQYLRVYIGQLRQKLNDPLEDGLIVTEPGIGYRLADG